MNKLLIAASVVAISACSSVHEVSKEEQASNFERKSISIMNQVELSSMQKHGFCEGDALKSYIETKFYYQFTCVDKRSFMLRKEGAR